MHGFVSRYQLSLNRALALPIASPTTELQAGREAMAADSNTRSGSQDAAAPRYGTGLAFLAWQAVRRHGDCGQQSLPDTDCHTAGFLFQEY